jgi:uncharacterized protein
MVGHDVIYTLFTIKNDSYLYDRASNVCVPIDAASSMILDSYLCDGSDATRDRFEEILEKNELPTAIEHLDLLRHHGMLRETTLDDPSSLCHNEELENILASACRHLTLNVTDQCNLRCAYCVYSGQFPEERSHGARQMSWEVARKSLDHFLSQNHPDQRLTFYGGEPLLNWDLVRQCVDYVRRTKDRVYLPIHLTTNLIGLSDSQAAFLIDNDVHLQVSLDGPEVIHNSARWLAGGGGSHALVLNGVERLVTRNAEYCTDRLKINCTCSDTANVQELFTYFSAYPFSDLEVSVSCVRTPEGEKDITSDETWFAWQRQLDALIPEYYALMRMGKPVNHKLFNNFFESVFVRLAKRPLTPATTSHVLKKQCIPGINGIFVDTGGTYFSCENFAHSENSIGSVETGVELEKAQRLLAKFVGISAEICTKCWASRLCSLCFLHSLDRGAISRETMLRSCNFERRKIITAFERFMLIWGLEPEEFQLNEFSLHSAVEK